MDISNKNQQNDSEKLPKNRKNDPKWNLKKTSTTPSYSGPIPAQKYQGRIVLRKYFFKINLVIIEISMACDLSF